MVPRSCFLASDVAEQKTVVATAKDDPLATCFSECGRWADSQTGELGRGRDT